MSLLLKALKQVEQGPGKTPPAHTVDFDLEPIKVTSFSAHKEWVQPHDTDPAPGNHSQRPQGGFSLPNFGLVPATAILAVLIALGYGFYVYLAISQPTLLATPVTRTPDNSTTSTGVSQSAQTPTIAMQDTHGVKDATERIDPSIGRALTAGRISSASHTKPLATPTVLSKAPAAPATAHALPAMQSHSSQTDLDAAYQAYQSGRFDDAKKLYSAVAEREKNPDALLGLAAIAMIQGHQSESIHLYQRVISVDPRNAVAQAALIDALGTTDSTAAESRLKNQIQQSPSAYLYYALGNLHAEEKRWSDAESAYFEALKREPSNADYAFNLAVSLDHLNQNNAAILQYENAISLTGKESKFSIEQAQSRIQQLKAR